MVLTILISVQHWMKAAQKLKQGTHIAAAVETYMLYSIYVNKISPDLRQSNAFSKSHEYSVEKKFIEEMSQKSRNFLQICNIWTPRKQYFCRNLII